jgi:hypothetical protein
MTDDKQARAAVKPIIERAVTDLSEVGATRSEALRLLAVQAVLRLCCDGDHKSLRALKKTLVAGIDAELASTAWPLDQ